MLDPTSAHMCTLMMEVVAFGGTLTWLDDDLPLSSTWTLAFGDLDVTCLAHDVILGGLALDGDGLMQEDTWHGTLALDGLTCGLGRPNFPPCSLNVTFNGHDVTLLGFYLMYN